MERRSFLGLVATAPLAPSVTVDMERLRHIGQVSVLAPYYGGLTGTGFTRFPITGFKILRPQG